MYMHVACLPPHCAKLLYTSVWKCFRMLHVCHMLFDAYMHVHVHVESRLDIIAIIVCMCMMHGCACTYVVNYVTLHVHVHVLTCCIMLHACTMYVVPPGLSGCPLVRFKLFLSR